MEFNNYFFEGISRQLSAPLDSIYGNFKQSYNAENNGGYVRVELLKENEEHTLKEVNITRTLALLAQLQTENFSWKDITVLCRGNKEATVLANALLENDIPVVSSESLLLATSPKVQFLTAFLQFLLDNNDKRAIIHIVQYLCVVGKLPYDLHTALTIGLKSSNSFKQLLQEHDITINYKSHQLSSIYETIEYLIRIFNLSENADVYLLFFMDFIQEYEQKNTSNISGFLEYWETKKTKKSVVLPDGIDAVNIMTIHKSKGLEFPVVIFPFANWPVKATKSELWIDLETKSSKEPQAALIAMNKSLEHTKFADAYNQEQQKSILDDFNILYVALTRPQTRLYMLSSEGKGSKGLSNYFVDELKQSENWNEEHNYYEYGVEVANTTKKKRDNSGWNLSSLESSNWRDKISMSLLAPEVWEENPIDDKREYGKLLHLALSKIYTEKDIDTAVESLLLEGLVTVDIAKDLKKELETIVALPQLMPFFKADLQVKNEAELLSPDGTVYRPDKVIIEDNKAIIIDYKTGEKQASHKKQVDQYAAVLERAGYSTVERYLFYTEQKELEQL